MRYKTFASVIDNADDIINKSVHYYAVNIKICSEYRTIEADSLNEAKLIFCKQYDNLIDELCGKEIFFYNLKDDGTIE